MSTLLAVIKLTGGHHYTSAMPNEEAFHSANKENATWAMLIDLATGKIIQTHGTAVCNVDLNAAASITSTEGTPIVSPQTAITPISVNWELLNGFEALAMDAGGQLRGFTSMPDNVDAQGNYFITAVRATDIGASYGVIMDPIVMNSINPGLNLTPGTLPHTQSLLRRGEGMPSRTEGAVATASEQPATLSMPSHMRAESLMNTPENCTTIAPSPAVLQEPADEQQNWS